MRSLLIAAFALSVVSTALGQSAQPRPPDQSWVAPAEASARTNPLANRPDTAAGGRKVFAQRCGQCHGDDGRGSERAPDLTTADAQSQTDGALFWKISGGNTRAGMPAFSFLPEPQRWQLVMYLRTEARGGSQRQ